MSKLVVAIPAFNEELTLPRVLVTIREALFEEGNLSVVVVDDGSTDTTSEASLTSGADVVVRHKQNLGVAQAYKTAIRVALDLGADVICTIDADRQYEPEEIPRLVKLVREEEADLVIGSRFINPSSRRKVPTTNRMANEVMAFLVSMLIGKYLSDTESGFRAIIRRAARDLRRLGVVSFSTDMILDVSKRGYRIAEVPVSVTYHKSSAF